MEAILSFKDSMIPYSGIKIVLLRGWGDSISEVLAKKA